MSPWKPGLGAWLEGEGVRFRVWSPAAKSIDVMLETAGGSSHILPLDPLEDGYFSGVSKNVAAGARYRYRIDGDRCLPDPASRYQPEGVHGPSALVDPSRFSWSDQDWQGIDLEKLILYELHVGTFSPEGTFAGVREKLGMLKELGITAIELMPLADFPGNRNWGYDGVDLFAPARCYGTPDDLRELVDAAHALKIAVFLDVVYNHLGPEGAYLGAFSPFYFSSKHKSPWGDAVNLDDQHCEHARNFFIENALHWIHEYHIDGLRLDATHAMMDDSPTHFLRELADRVHASLPRDRNVLLIAEDDRNLARLIQPAEEKGYGLDGVWADDFHHQVRVLLAGDSDGYFQDFSGDAKDLAETIRQGWFYTGQRSRLRNEPRGTCADGIPLEKFVHCIQNHDQIGNRALGDRLNFTVAPASFRAASALLMVSPSTPLMFMGQEWGASSPFCYFTDHPEALGKLVTEGRRNEFRHFKAFTHPESRKLIPDPQALSTFEQSRLRWEERSREPHAGLLRLYQTLIELRKTESAWQNSESSSLAVESLGDNIVVLKRQAQKADPILAVVCLKGQGRAILGTGSITKPPSGKQWKVFLTTEDASFTSSPLPPRVKDKENFAIEFQGPCAVFLRPTLPAWTFHMISQNLT